MKRLTEINSEGRAVFKQSYECERCNEPQWRMPDMGDINPTDRLAVYEDMQEKIEKRVEAIKASSEYPHNFTGQMVEDFEWVLGLISGNGGGK